MRQRQREAVSAAELHLDEFKDPDLLHELAKRYNGKHPWVLVTGDDSMPAEHGPAIIETRATLATIHPEYPAELTEHHWRVDMVQRWAHAMQAQQPETVRRYALNGSPVWQPRRRHIRQIERHGWTPWRPEDPQQARAERVRPSDTPVTPEPSVSPQERFPGLS